MFHCALFFYYALLSLWSMVSGKGMAASVDLPIIRSAFVFYVLPCSEVPLQLFSNFIQFAVTCCKVFEVSCMQDCEEGMHKLSRDADTAGFFLVCCWKCL